MCKTASSKTYKPVLLCIIALLISSCAAHQSKTDKLLCKTRTELKQRYGIKNGEIVAKFDLPNFSKKESKLYASYYSTVVSDATFNKKFLERFGTYYRTPNRLQENSYNKLGILDKKLLEIDDKYNLLPKAVNHNLNKIAQQFKSFPILPKRDKRNYIEILAELHNSTKNIPMYVPVEKPTVTSLFGKRKNSKRRKMVHHTGIDLVGSKNCKIYASADGIVEVVARVQGYGNMIVIRHDKDVSTRYAHLSNVTVAEGARVSLGQYIGNQGHSGTATGPHLHFEVVIRGVPVDPMLFIGDSLI